MSLAASQSREYDTYFQTTDTLESQARRAAKASNTHGRPVRLRAKLSAVVLDPSRHDNATAAAVVPEEGPTQRVFVAGGDAVVRRVRLPKVDRSVGGAGGNDGGGRKGEDGKEDDVNAVDLILTGPKAPLTSLAAVPATGDDGVMVFAGSWDKSVYMWELRNDKQIGEVKIFSGGHSDFIKCIAVWQHPTQDVKLLLSGSADRTLTIWDIKSGKRLKQVKNLHATSLNTLAVDPILTSGDSDVETVAASATDPRALKTTFSVVSGASDGELLMTEFRVSVKSADATTVTVEPTGRKLRIDDAHPTTVYGVVFHGEDGALATASADGTATVLQRRVRDDNDGDKSSGGSGGSGDDKPLALWEVETRFKHDGHVRCVAAETDEGSGPDGPRIYTGGRDENVKMWSSSTGELLCTFRGHFDEVTGIVVDESSRYRRAISVSLDGTVRTWDDLEIGRIQKGDDAEEDDKEKIQPSLLTAEEEAELAELMDDDDD